MRQALATAVKRSRFQVFLAIYFLLLIANTIFCHYVGDEFLRAARQMHIVKEAGGEPATVEIADEQMARGGSLVAVNLPLLIGLGSIVRQPDPHPGLLYWTLLILGSTYAPFVVTMLLVFLVHAPRQPDSFPGVDLDDGSLEDEEDDGNDHRD